MATALDGFDGLTHCSTGLCPGCAVCQQDHDCSDEDMRSGAAFDEGSFSWSSCEGCGSTLGGNRYAAHGVDSDGAILHLDVCEDCLLALN